MPIKAWNDWSLSERGKADAQRHRDKIDKSIRENVQDVISRESIITRKAGKKVMIPVRGLKDYKFIHGHDEDEDGDSISGGLGQGPAKPGDVIARRAKDGDGVEGAGSDPGDYFMETEVSLDYLLDIMFADLGLPYIEEKTSAAQLIPVGFRFDTISKVGIIPRLHKKRTLKEALKRMVVFVDEVSKETGCDEDTATKALVQTGCDIEAAIILVKTNQVDQSIETNLLIDSDDLRFKQIDEDLEIRSNAVIFCVMDSSGSMTTEKKYLVRSLLFWFVSFLRKTYDNVQIRFVTHTTDARLVEEESFFGRASDGGTLGAPAMALVQYTMETEYPVESWNRYVTYSSDGELWDMKEMITSIKSLLKSELNMFCYTQVGEESPYQTEELLDAMKKSFKFNQRTEKNGNNFYKNTTDHVFACEITKKEDIWDALKFFLFEPGPKKG